MGKKKSAYEIIVYTAYGYFMLIGAAWFIMALMWGGYFSYWAFSSVALFGVQAWFQHKLTNLILGVLTLGASIFVALEFVMRAMNSGFNFFVFTMTALSLISLALSGVLIFSYTKLSFKDQ